MTDQVLCLLCIKEYGIPDVQFGSFRGWKRWVRKGLVVLTSETLLGGVIIMKECGGFSSGSLFLPEASI